MKSLGIYFLLVVICFSALGAPGERLGRARKKNRYQEQFEKAIITSDFVQIDRLLKRYQKMPIKKFEEMIGWTNDIAEIRKMRFPTRMENAAMITGGVITGLSMAGLFLYYRRWIDRDDFFNPHYGYLRSVGETSFTRALFAGVLCARLAEFFVGLRTRGRYNRALDMKNKVAEEVKKIKETEASKMSNQKILPSVHSVEPDEKAANS